MCALVDDQLIRLTSEQKAAISRLENVGEIVPTRKLGGGSADTSVYLVDIRDFGETQGTWVLKLDVTWRARNESEYHARIKASPLAPYVPDLQRVALGDGEHELSALLYSLATGSSQYSKTLEDLISKETRRPAKMIADVGEALLVDWNGQCKYFSGDAYVMMRTWFREFIDSSGILVEKKLRSICGEPVKRRIEGEPLGRWLINPIHYLIGQVTPARSLTATVPIGYLHGDLHPGNIIASTLPRSETDAEPHFALTDFSFFREGNVLFDMAYLEMAVLWHRFGQFRSGDDRKLWWALEEHLRSELVPHSDFDLAGANEAKSIIFDMRKMVQSRARSVNRVDDYWLSYLAASVEAGLTLALNPERIAKEIPVQPFLQAAALLTAASRFQRILDLQSTQDVAVKPGGEDTPTQIIWPGVVP